MAAGGAPAVAGRVSGDRLHLRVDDVWVARRDRDVDPSELVARRRAGVHHAATRVHVRAGRIRAAADGGAIDEPVCVRGDRRETRATA